MISTNSPENRTGLAFSRLCGASGMAPVVERSSTIGVVTACMCMVVGGMAAIAAPEIVDRAIALLSVVLEWH